MTQLSKFTTASGVHGADDRSSLSAGQRGPLLQQNFHLFDEFQPFNDFHGLAERLYKRRGIYRTHLPGAGRGGES